MRPNVRTYRFKSSPKKQAGSMLLIVVFMMVVLGLLVTAMGSFLSDSSQKTSVEVRATRALMAAQSGLEYGFYKVGNIDKNDSTAIDEIAALCDGSTIYDREFADDNIKGLAQCRATVTCQTVADSETYAIKSEGNCGEPLTASHSKDDTRTDFAVNRTLTAEAQ